MPSAPSTRDQRRRGCATVLPGSPQLALPDPGSVNANKCFDTDTRPDYKRVKFPTGWRISRYVSYPGARRAVFPFTSTTESRAISERSKPRGSGTLVA